jgi:hypothetical protein
VTRLCGICSQKISANDLWNNGQGGIVQ